MTKVSSTPPALSDDFNAIINNAQKLIGQDTTSNKKSIDGGSWQHFSFICDKTLSIRFVASLNAKAFQFVS